MSNNTANITGTDNKEQLKDTFKLGKYEFTSRFILVQVNIHLNL